MDGDRSRSFYQGRTARGPWCGGPRRLPAAAPRAANRGKGSTGGRPRPSGLSDQAVEPGDVLALVGHQAADERQALGSQILVLESALVVLEAVLLPLLEGLERG